MRCKLLVGYLITISVDSGNRTGRISICTAIFIIKSFRMNMIKLKRFSTLLPLSSFLSFGVVKISGQGRAEG
jgi:hypothetical protein